MTTKLGGELQQPITGITLGCEKIRNLGYSSLKSREILGVHSRRARIFAAISLPCHFPCQVSPKNKKRVEIVVKISLPDYLSSLLKIRKTEKSSKWNDQFDSNFLNFSNLPPKSYDFKFPANSKFKDQITPKVKFPNYSKR